MCIIWLWPISSRSFAYDFAKKNGTKKSCLHHNFPSSGGIFSYLIQIHAFTTKEKVCRVYNDLRPWPSKPFAHGRVFAHAKKRDYMMTSSHENIFRVTGPLCGEFIGHRWLTRTSQWRGALMLSLICAWINDWANNREAGDLIRHRPQFDVIVMKSDYALVLLTETWSTFSLSPLKSLYYSWYLVFPAISVHFKKTSPGIYLNLDGYIRFG